MDSLFGGVERTPVESAVLDYNDKHENDGFHEHLEHAGTKTHAAAVVRGVNPLAPVQEKTV